MPKASASDDKVIDWLLIKHEETDDAVKATNGALEYLRNLKRGIPTPEVEVATFAMGAPVADDLEGDGGGERRRGGRGRVSGSGACVPCTDGSAGGRKGSLGVCVLDD